mmetsp:Transcript_51294/g.155352  ORF Transcript_51294/g.155352 Transcript_51294/m.155352 type:complete len:416 (-) Transcript_51294:420-1667(-)
MLQLQLQGCDSAFGIAHEATERLLLSLQVHVAATLVVAAESHLAVLQATKGRDPGLGRAARVPAGRPPRDPVEDWALLRKMRLQLLQRLAHDLEIGDVPSYLRPDLQRHRVLDCTREAGVETEGDRGAVVLPLHRHGAHPAGEILAVRASNARRLSLEHSVPRVPLEALEHIAGTRAVGYTMGVRAPAKVREEDVEPTVEPGPGAGTNGPAALAHGVPEGGVDLALPRGNELVEERQQRGAPLLFKLRGAACEHALRYPAQRAPVLQCPFEGDFWKAAKGLALVFEEVLAYAHDYDLACDVLGVARRREGRREQLCHALRCAGRDLHRERVHLAGDSGGPSVGPAKDEPVATNGQGLLALVRHPLGPDGLGVLVHVRRDPLRHEQEEVLRSQRQRVVVLECSGHCLDEAVLVPVR